MGEPKTLSSNDVRRIVGFSGKQYKRVVWHTSELVVKPFLNISDYVDTVNFIIRDITKKDGTIAVEFIDFAIRMNVIESYAFIELPKDPDEIYRIIYCSDLYDTICSNANKCQIESIKNAVMMSIGLVSNNG